MGVGTWGYGTGATTAGAHPFSLTIQGVDVIGWVPLESIKVGTTMTSNGTLDFEIVGNPELPDLPIRPFAYADVVLTEHTGTAAVTGAFQDELTQDDSFDEGEAVELAPPEIIFSGIIIGTAEVGLAAGEAHRIKCVDYGYLLDACPMKRGVMIESPGLVVPAPGSFATYLYEVVLAIMGQAATSGITALMTNVDWRGPGEGRVLYGHGTTAYINYLVGYVYDDAGEGDPFSAGSIRANLDTAVERARIGGLTSLFEPYYTTSPIAVYVDPQRRLNVHPTNIVWGLAPFVIDNDSTSGTAIRTEYLEVEYDYTALAAGVFVNDSDQDVGGDNSNFYVGDTTVTNGYYICPDSTDAQLASAADVAPAAERYMSNAGHEIVGGSLIVTSTEQLKIATGLLLTDSRFGYDGDVMVITEVSTEFYPGTSGSRRMEVKFIPEASYGAVGGGSVARTTRQQLTRVGTAWTVPTTI